MRTVLAKFTSKTLAVAALFLVVGCGTAEESINSTEKLSLVMRGDFTVPFDQVTYPTAIANQSRIAAPATGNNDPKNETFTLSGLSLLDAEGTTIDLFEGSTATEYIIVNRNQIIFEADLSDHKDTVISSATVSFSAAVTASSPAKEDLSITLPQTDYVHTETWTVTSAIDKRLMLYVQWKNTVTVDEDSGAESIIAPSIRTELIDE
jgi:hypothetical protein